jgi:diguanylate cyclase (GGDEF)-like protein
LERTRRQLKANRSELNIWLALALGAALAGAVALFYLFALARLEPRGGDHPLFVPVVAIAVWAAFRHPVPIRNRRYSISMSLSEIGALTALVFCSPGWVLLAACAGNVAAFAQRRVEPVKIFTNCVVYAAGVAAGAYTYDKLIGRVVPSTPHGWAFGFLAVVVVNVVNGALLLLLMGAVDTRWRHPEIRQLFVQLAPGVFMSALIGLISVCVVWVEHWGILLSLALVAAAVSSYREAALANIRYHKLGRLFNYTRSIGALMDSPAVVQSVLEAVRTLLAVDRAELVVPFSSGTGAGGPGRVALHCTLTGEGPPRIEGLDDLTLLDVVAFGRGAALYCEGQQQEHELGKALQQHGVREALIAPLNSDDPKEGYLLAGDRPYRHEGFNAGDLSILEGIATIGGIAARSSRLYEQLVLEAEVRKHQARHDALTSLPNREMLLEHLDSALASSSEENRVAVLLLDLDGFKDINDTLGHLTGDAVLVEVARRLGTLGTGGDIVARLGGDEFALVMSGVRSEEVPAAAAEEMVRRVRQPMEIEGLLLDVRASLGVALSALHSRDVTTLLKHADIAMYNAKRSGGGVCFYDRAADSSNLRRLRLATELRQAMEFGDLHVWYQPVVDLESGSVLSCEALLRWEHDHFGPVPPAEFIPVAESSGLIDELTWWVLDTALEQVASWRARLFPDLRVSVNFSARSLMTLHLAERLRDAASRVGLGPEAITLELTETSAMADPQSSARVLGRLRKLGVHVSIDDYGTGFSSLSRLKQLPFDELKIDRSFVKEMTRDRGDEAIVYSTIELARSLGRSVTAEGVEDQATLLRLESFGCNAAQGFYLARPLPAVQCEAWLVAAKEAAASPTNVLRLERARALAERAAPGASRRLSYRGAAGGRSAGA